MESLRIKIKESLNHNLKNKDEVAKRLDELNQDANDLLGSEEW